MFWCCPAQPEVEPLDLMFMTCSDQGHHYFIIVQRNLYMRRHGWRTLDMLVVSSWFALGDLTLRSARTDAVEARFSCASIEPHNVLLYIFWMPFVTIWVISFSSAQDAWLMVQGSGLVAQGPGSWLWLMPRFSFATPSHGVAGLWP